MRNLMKYNQGFSLIEILVSITILMILSACLLEGLSYSAHWSSQSKFTNIATSLAQQEMEKIKSLSWDKIISSAKTSVDANKFPGYEKEIKVTDIYLDVPNNKILGKKVEVTIHCKDKSFSLITLLHNYNS